MNDRALDAAVWAEACKMIEEPERLLEGPLGDCILVNGSNRMMVQWMARDLANLYAKLPDDEMAMPTGKLETVYHYLPAARTRVLARIDEQRAEAGHEVGP